MYYQNTIAEIRVEIQKILRRKGDAPVEINNKTGRATITYILWMCDEIEQMQASSFDDALKAARWIGWVLANVESNRIWNNNRSRDLVRQDRLLGFDKPHQQ